MSHITYIALKTFITRIIYITHIIYVIDITWITHILKLVFEIYKKILFITFSIYKNDK